MLYFDSSLINLLIKNEKKESKNRKIVAPRSEKEVLEMEFNKVLVPKGAACKKTQQSLFFFFISSLLQELKGMSQSKNLLFSRTIEPLQKGKWIVFKTALIDLLRKKIKRFYTTSSTCKIEVCPFSSTLTLSKEEEKEVVQLGSLYFLKEENSLTLLCHALREGKRDLILSLLHDMQERGYAFKALHFYACKSAKESFGAVLNYIQEKDEEEPLTGYAPLHIAVAAGNYDFAESLLCCGADVNKPDKWGKTAAHYAAHVNNSSLIYLLKEHGAYLNAQDLEGLTPLHIASMKKNTNILHTLRLLGANASIKDKKGRSAGHMEGK